MLIIAVTSCVQVHESMGSGQTKIKPRIGKIMRLRMDER
jgi:hypothetical protein